MFRGRKPLPEEARIVRQVREASREGPRQKELEDILPRVSQGEERHREAGELLPAVHRKQVGVPVEEDLLRAAPMPQAQPRSAVVPLPAPRPKAVAALPAAAAPHPVQAAHLQTQCRQVGTTPHQVVARQAPAEHRAAAAPLRLEQGTQGARAHLCQEPVRRLLCLR
ncbi:MAG: hypothetical protein HYU64_15405 [Armatimonadetes bacterium]|nr:hypothetical protein [Armatimonadota bacterium]